MSENKCSYRIAYEKQKKRAERAEAERDAAKELAESRWVELEALLGEWNLCVKLSGSPTHGGLAGHVGRLRTQAAQTDAAQSTIADLKAEVGRLRDFVGDLADEPCSYGDGCPAFAGTRHGTCLHCQARAAQSTIAELRGALTEAIESIEDWSGYASPYFRDKYDVEGQIASLRSVLKEH